MLTIMQRGMLAQFSTNYQLLKGKYLIPTPPKRSLSSYMIYSQEARKSIQGDSFVEINRKIGAQWKELPDVQKATYSKKAEQQRAAKIKDIQAYDRKYKWPFTVVTARGLIMSDFYKQNKFASIQQGNEPLKLHIEKMSPEEKQAYEKKAASQREEKEKLKKHYEIPEPPYTSFNSYLLSLRKADRNFPKKADLNDKELEKLQNKYDAEIQKYKAKLEKFVERQNITMKELSKLVNKNRSKNDIEAEKKIIAAEKTKSEVQKLKKALIKGKERLSKEKKNTTKTAKSQIKKINDQLEKVKNEIKRKTEKAQAAMETARKLKSEESNKKVEKKQGESQ